MKFIGLFVLLTIAVLGAAKATSGIVDVARFRSKLNRNAFHVKEIMLAITMGLKVRVEVVNHPDIGLVDSDPSQVWQRNTVEYQIKNGIISMDQIEIADKVSSIGEDTVEICGMPEQHLLVSSDHGNYFSESREHHLVSKFLSSRGYTKQSKGFLSILKLVPSKKGYGNQCVKYSYEEGDPLDLLERFEITSEIFKPYHIKYTSTGSSTTASAEEKHMSSVKKKASSHKMRMQDIPVDSPLKSCRQEEWTAYYDDVDDDRTVVVSSSKKGLSKNRKARHVNPQWFDDDDWYAADDDDWYAPADDDDDWYVADDDDWYAADDDDWYAPADDDDDWYAPADDDDDDWYADDDDDWYADDDDDWYADDDDDWYADDDSNAYYYIYNGESSVEDGELNVIYSTSHGFVCAEYAGLAPGSFDFNYNWDSGTAEQETYSIIDGIDCVNCYAYLGATFIVHLQYVNDVLGFETKIVGGAGGNIDLRMNNPSVSGSHQVTLIDAQEDEEWNYLTLYSPLNLGLGFKFGGLDATLTGSGSATGSAYVVGGASASMTLGYLFAEEEFSTLTSGSASTTPLQYGGSLALTSLSVGLSLTGVLNLEFYLSSVVEVFFDVALIGKVNYQWGTVAASSFTPKIISTSSGSSKASSNAAATQNNRLRANHAQMPVPPATNYHAHTGGHHATASYAAGDVITVEIEYDGFLPNEPTLVYYSLHNGYISVPIAVAEMSVDTYGSGRFANDIVVPWNLALAYENNRRQRQLAQEAQKQHEIDGRNRETAVEWRVEVHVSNIIDKRILTAESFQLNLYDNRASAASLRHASAAVEWNKEMIIHWKKRALNYYRVVDRATQHGYNRHTATVNIYGVFADKSIADGDEAAISKLNFLANRVLLAENVVNTGTASIRLREEQLPQDFTTAGKERVFFVVASVERSSSVIWTAGSYEVKSITAQGLRSASAQGAVAAKSTKAQDRYPSSSAGPTATASAATVAESATCAGVIKYGAYAMTSLQNVDMFSFTLYDTEIASPEITIYTDETCVQSAAPVASPVASPVAAPVTSPVAAPVTSPVSSPVSAPVAAPTNALPTSPTAPTHDDDDSDDNDDHASATTVHPSKAPSRSPTTAPEVVLTFATTLTLANYPSSTINSNSATVIKQSVADAMDISAEDVTIDSITVVESSSTAATVVMNKKTASKLKISSVTYSVEIEVSISTTTTATEATSTYTDLVTSLVTAVNDGSFESMVHSNANACGDTDLQASTVETVSYDGSYSINNDDDTSSSSSSSGGGGGFPVGAIAGIVVGIVVLLIAVGFVYYRRSVNTISPTSAPTIANTAVVLPEPTVTATYNPQ